MSDSGGFDPPIQYCLASDFEKFQKVFEQKDFLNSRSFEKFEKFQKSYEKDHKNIVHQIDDMVSRQMAAMRSIQTMEIDAQSHQNMQGKRNSQFDSYITDINYEISKLQEDLEKTQKDLKRHDNDAQTSMLKLEDKMEQQFVTKMELESEVIAKLHKINQDAGDSATHLRHLIKNINEESASFKQKYETDLAKTEDFIRYCQKVQTTTSKCNDQNRCELSLAQIRIEECQNLIEKIFMNFETKDNVAVIQKRLDKFANIEHVNKIKTVLLPKVEDFSAKVGAYDKAMQEFKYCIRQFDEMISMKANKVEFFQMRGDLEKMFIPRYEVDSMFKIFGQIEGKYLEEKKARDKDFREFQQNLMFDHEDKILDICREKIECFEKVEKSFSKFFDGEFLEQLLDRKADIEMVEQIAHQKASTQEFVKLQRNFDALNEKLKQMVILQLETTSTLRPVHDSVNQFADISKKQFQAKVQKLQNDATILSKQINKDTTNVVKRNSIIVETKFDKFKTLKQNLNTQNDYYHTDNDTEQMLSPPQKDNHRGFNTSHMFKRTQMSSLAAPQITQMGSNKTIMSPKFEHLIERSTKKSVAKSAYRFRKTNRKSASVMDEY